MLCKETLMAAQMMAVSLDGWQPAMGELRDQEGGKGREYTVSGPCDEVW